jgi:hypothetical protein
MRHLCTKVRRCCPWVRVTFSVTPLKQGPPCSKSATWSYLCCGTGKSLKVMWKQLDREETPCSVVLAMVYGIERPVGGMHVCNYK